MMPGGHLATSVALSGVAYISSGSVEVAAGCFVGGFLIDVDHYLDYLLFEKQWRRPGPINFLRYYFTYSPKKLVLPLHSYEFMTILLFVMFMYPAPLLVGYWIGAAMHLICDIVVNGENALKHAVLFYLFAYRVSHRFAAHELMDVETPPAAGQAPIREFFRWRPVEGVKHAKHAEQPATENKLTSTATGKL
jgi:hypothetical protein